VAAVIGIVWMQRAGQPPAPADAVDAAGGGQTLAETESVEMAKAGDAGGEEDGSEEDGLKLYNSAGCAHCHGPEAQGPEPKTDLRRLTKRYQDDAGNVFETTVRQGREDKGMPKWGEILSAEEIAKIKAYILSVQAK
jgi:mono/diheme cytochrome c family protein